MNLSDAQAPTVRAGSAVSRAAAISRSTIGAGRYSRDSRQIRDVLLKTQEIQNGFAGVPLSFENFRQKLRTDTDSRGQISLREIGAGQALFEHCNWIVHAAGFYTSTDCLTSYANVRTFKFIKQFSRSLSSC